MTAKDILAVLAGVMGVAMGASPLIQALRVHRMRRSADVSLSFLLVIMFGGLAWLSYGIVIANPALVIANSVGVVSSTTTVAVVLHWRATEPGSLAPLEEPDRRTLRRVRDELPPAGARR
jgi:uncharacterized protein with PQ loop repeat